MWHCRRSGSFIGALFFPLALAAAAVSVADEGALRIWGHGGRDRDEIDFLVRAWQSGFHKQQPSSRFVTSLKGDKSAIGGLYTGAADIALMERGLAAIEEDSYEQVFGRTDPFAVMVATGSVDRPGHAPALAVFVRKDNPLERLTLAQLDAIIGADHRSSARNIRSWGELGAKGAQAAREIHVYVLPIEDDASQFLQKAVMGGSQKWTANLTELPDGARVVAALARDRDGIAIATMADVTPEVRAVALAASDAGPYYFPTRDAVAARSYPLTRALYAYTNRDRGKTLDARVRDYLRYILGPEGQADIARDGGYFPLPADLAARERAKLE